MKITVYLDASLNEKELHIITLFVRALRLSKLWTPILGWRSDSIGLAGSTSREPSSWTLRLMTTMWASSSATRTTTSSTTSCGRRTRRHTGRSVDKKYSFLLLHSRNILPPYDRVLLYIMRKKPLVEFMYLCQSFIHV